MEARLLQNVVKLWIVKRLYEFVLFAQASRFLSLSLFSTRAPALLLSPSSFSPLSVRVRMSTLFLLAIDLAFSMPCSIPMDYPWNIFLDCNRRNSFVRSFVHCEDLDSLRFTSMFMGTIFVTNIRSAMAIDRATKDDDERLTTAYRGRQVYTMSRRDHRKTYLLTSCRYVRPRKHTNTNTRECREMERLVSTASMLLGDRSFSRSRRL